MLIPQAILSSKIEAATDCESSRYALGGVLVGRTEEGQPHVVATDGRRIHHATWTECPKETESLAAALHLDATHRPGLHEIVPTKAWAGLAKLPPKRSPKPCLMNVMLDEPTANGTVTFGATDLERTDKPVFRTCEWRYPKWQDAMPKYTEIADDLAMKLAHHYDWQAWASEATAEVPAFADLRFAPLKHDPARQEQLFAGPAVVITLDPRYVIEACQFIMKAACSPERRGVDFVIPLSGQGAALLRQKHHEGREATAIIMPLARDR